MARPRVDVQEGKLVGVVDETVYGVKYYAFRGIPYAKPPVGELRFKDPVPVSPWSGERDASKHGNLCIQQNILMKYETIGHEDCLYLNVYTTNLKPDAKRAVMVWIHGGGFFVGTGDELFYGADYIVEKDVVLVSLNYRLGALGFLNLDDEVATGNQGIKDGLLALKWIQQNIGAFGGDSENVTIFGESAGAAYVHLLTLLPQAEGLFHKAIIQSGVMLNPWAYNEEPSAHAFQLTEILGKKTTDPKVAYEFLKTVEAEAFIYKVNNPSLELEYRQTQLPFVPNTDSKSKTPIFTESLQKMVQRKIKVPLIIGFTGMEGAFIVNSKFFGDITEDFLKQVDNDFSKIMPSKILASLPSVPVTLKELRASYFGDKPVSNDTLTNYATIVSDILFVRGIMDVVDLQTKKDVPSESPTYLYKFDYKNEKNSIMRKIFDIQRVPGTSHTEDLGYLFYPHVAKVMKWSAPEKGSDDYKMIERMVQMWTNFAKTGNPTPTVNEVIPVEWTPIKPGDTLNYLNITASLEMKTFQKGKERWNWENIRNK